MLIIEVYVNLNQIDKIGVLNTGRIRDGKHLYRIAYPEYYKRKYNYLEFYHDRDKPWTFLIEKVLKGINQYE